jgi:hypothetical protein
MGLLKNVRIAPAGLQLEIPFDSLHYLPVMVRDVAGKVVLKW